MGGVAIAVGLAVVGFDARHDWGSGAPWFIAAGALFIIAVVVFFAPWVPRQASAVNAAPSQGAVREPRFDTVAVDPNARDIDRTPEELWAIFNGLTDLQAHQVVDVVIGQPMTISGEVRSVSAFTSGSSQVTLPKPEHRTIYLYFNDKAWINRLAMLKAGDHIRVRGRIRRITSVDLDLDRCGFVDERGTTLGA
jgi:hypothetical protein